MLNMRFLFAAVVAALFFTLPAASPQPAVPFDDCICAQTEQAPIIDILVAGGQTLGVACIAEGAGSCNQECVPIADRGCKWKATYHIGWPVGTVGPFTAWPNKKPSVQKVHQGQTYEAAAEDIYFRTACGSSVAVNVSFTENATGNLLARIAFNGDCDYCAPTPP